MGYVVCAKWTAQEGEEERVDRAVRSLTEPSRAEPGCLYYQPCRDPEDPRVFFIFEIYADEAGYKAHGESEHFKEFGLGQAIPVLEGRERQFYVTIDA